ncbi:MAG: type II secretion system minor pseudopilin GspK [Pseudomonadales bacterium]|nr:type II secretion system minor pseudopilin GspK [Halioglobus sp.]MCP5131425.1 type II secretion system minor pseudopilin GspK [Pseudomonadales bacterium]
MHYRHSRQRGAALIVALLVFALCTALVVAMEMEFNRFYQRGANILLAEQANAYLRGAEELATLALLADYDSDQGRENPRDDLLEMWAQTPAPYALDEGGWMLGCLRDLQGRFNLNRLAERVPAAEGAPKFTAAQAQFIRLLQTFEEPQLSEQEAILITESVSDWLDADIQPAPDGAEDDYYFGLTPGYRSANRPMSSVSELRAVANVTPQIYRALEPLVSVWPQVPAPLNIHTASPAVLRSINANDDLTPLSAADGLVLAEQRESIGFESVQAFLESSVFSGKQGQMTAVEGLLGEETSYFLLSAEVEVADRRMRLYSVLQRGGRQVTALARTSGSLDDSQPQRGDQDSCTIAPSLDW